MIENRTFEKLPPLDHGGSEMKFTYFHHNCCKKIEFSKKIKSLQFFVVQGSLNPNITSLGEKL